jgi:hypothetical protein
LIVSPVTPLAVSPPLSSTLAKHSVRKMNGMATMPLSSSQVFGNVTSRSWSWAIDHVTTPSGSSIGSVLAVGPPTCSSPSPPPRVRATAVTIKTITITAAMGPHRRSGELVGSGERS